MKRYYGSYESGELRAWVSSPYGPEPLREQPAVREAVTLPERHVTRPMVRALLAVAILADASQNPLLAVALYGPFGAEVMDGWDMSSWEIRWDDVQRWIGTWDKSALDCAMREATNHGQICLDRIKPAPAVASPPPTGPTKG